MNKIERIKNTYLIDALYLLEHNDEVKILNPLFIIKIF